MALVGALWGWKIALAAIFIASLSGSIAGGVLLVMRLLRTDRKIPFGPFLALGLWVAALTYDALASWYFHWLDRIWAG
jgi:prepilin signal peptidase PulO-like enzyme (type II secretory pathway)